LGDANISLLFWLLVSVYQKASFIILKTLIFLKEEIIFHHREKKIANLFLKRGF